MMAYEGTMEDNGYGKVRDAYVDKGFLKVSDACLEEEHSSEVSGYSSLSDEEHSSEVSSYSSLSDEERSSEVSGYSSLSDEDNGSDVSDYSSSSYEVDSEIYAELLALPPHGSEVYIGGIPRDVTEEDLRELCKPFGIVFELSLMKEKDAKENKGYSFITFTTKYAANKAIKELHHTKFKGRTLRCSVYQAKHRLFIEKIPTSLCEKELRKILKESGPGIENIEFFKNSQHPCRNRGFVLVEYYNHACAEYARQKMTTADYKLDGITPTVSWADGLECVDDSPDAAKVKAIYMEDLPNNVTTRRLKEAFEQNPERREVPFQSPPHGYDAARVGQPIVIGRGALQAGMSIVPMVLPDGGLGYMLQPSGTDAHPSPLRSGASVHSSDYRECYDDPWAQMPQESRCGHHRSSGCA